MLILAPDPAVCGFYASTLFTSDLLFPAGQWVCFLYIQTLTILLCRCIRLTFFFLLALFDSTIPTVLLGLWSLFFSGVTNPLYFLF